MRMRNRFELDNDTDNIVIDHKTHLMWMQEPLKDVYTHDEAIDFYGYTDWRLPTIQELIDVVDYEKLNPASPESFKFNKEYIFWSNSSYIGDNNYAWAVDFRDGSVTNRRRSKALGVRLVKEIENPNEEGYPKQILDLFERLKKFI